MKRSIAKSLMQIAVLLFFLNSTSAYGLCCLITPEVAPATELPCHQAANSEAEMPAGDCCLMCMPMMLPTTGEKPARIAHHQAQVTAATHTLTAATEPPFRPPIYLLS